MNTAEILQEVKNGLGIYHNAQDETFLTLINTVKVFMTKGGVPESVANSAAAVGCITRGVIDVWNLGSGTGDFSPLFKLMLNQLATPESGV